MPPHARSVSDSIHDDGNTTICDLCKSDQTTTGYEVMIESTAQQQPSNQISELSTKVIPISSCDEAKTVSFDLTRNEVFDVIHIDDLIEEMDISIIWYTEGEFSQLIQDCRDTVSRGAEQKQWHYSEEMKSENHPAENDDDDDELCCRGLELDIEAKLEAVDEQYINLRTCRIRNSMDAVLEEQHMQRVEGIRDTDLLAGIYYGCTYQCQQEAERVALQDYMEALLVHA